MKSDKVILGLTVVLTLSLPLAIFSAQHKQQTTSKAAPATNTVTQTVVGGLSTDPNFFPISVWNQSNVASAAQYKDVGVNIFVGLYNATTEQHLSTLKSNGMQVIPEQNSVGLNSANKDSVVAWLQQDEPDNAQPNGSGGYGPCIPGSEMVNRYNQIKAADPLKKPVLLNLGRGVGDPNWVGRGSCSGQSDYPSYMGAGDIISFDVYPINDNLPITYVADGVDNLKRWSNNQKPIIAVLETTKIDAGTKPTPEQTKAEVWLALTHGATGIMYFAHQFQPFVEAGLLQDTAMTSMLKAVNAQIKALAPVLNSETVPNSATVTGSQRLDSITKSYNGETYIFVVNPNVSANAATITVPGIASGTVTVIDENRTIVLSGNTFQDNFAAYAVHLYKIAGAAVSGSPAPTTAGVIYPTFGVIAPCPSCASPTLAKLTTAPSYPVGGGTNPTSAQITPQPTTDPCTSSDASIASDNKKKSKHKKHKGGISNIMEALLQFFFELINLLLKLLGGGQLPTPQPQPSPSASPDPTTSPCDPAIVPTEVPTASVPQPTAPQTTTTPQPSTPAQLTPAPSIPAASGGKPNASNTGVPAGTQLTVVNGNQTYSTAGQVIEKVDIHGKVTLSGNNITLRNAIVRGPAGGGCTNGAGLEITGTGVKVENVEVVLSNPTACLDGVWMDNATLTKVHIHSGVDGVKAGANSIIEQSYIHDLNYFATDPNQGGGPTHNDAVQILSGTNITLRGNNFDLASTQNANAAVQVTQDFGTVGNLTIDGNWANGGGCTYNFSHKGGTSLAVSASNNKFGRSQGFANCTILISTKTTLSGNGNVWEDTNQPAPAPQQHD